MFHHCEAIIPYIESVIGIGIVKFLFIYSNKTYQDNQKKFNGNLD